MQYRTIFIAALQAAGLYIAGFLVPFLGQIAVLFVPVPLIVASVTAGRREGLMALALAGTLIAVIGSFQAPLVLFFLTFGFMAVMLAEGMRIGWKAEKTVLMGGILPVAGLGIIVLSAIVNMGKDPIQVLEEYLRGSIAEAAALYTKLGFVDMASLISSLSGPFVYYLVRLLPGILAATSLVQAACCYGFARGMILRRQGPAGPLASQPSLATWHAPDSWVWGLIISLGLVALPHETARLIGLNISIIYLVVYTTQGVAVLEYALRKAGIPAIGRSFIHTIILALPLIVAVIGFGVVDIWADFRKVRVSAQQK